MSRRGILLILFFLLGGCAISNPNSGENESDALWAKKKYEQALAIIEPAAERGYPWAQLRLGVAYEYGQGKPKSYTAALDWYRKTAIQTQSTAWADGLTLLSGGENGFFNQNSDAEAAQYLIARIYSQGGFGVEKNISEAWLWAQYVHDIADGEDILYCCENSKLKVQKIEFSRVESLLVNLKNNLSPQELATLKNIQAIWKPY